MIPTVGSLLFVLAPQLPEACLRCVLTPETKVGPSSVPCTVCTQSSVECKPQVAMMFTGRAAQRSAKLWRP